MYKRLLRMVNQFVCIERGPLNALTGKIVDVDPEVVEIQAFNRHGEEEGRWLVAIACITAVSIQDRLLEELALTVQWTMSSDEVREESEAS